MRIRKTFKATVWASAAICVAAVLFLGVSWIAEYRPDARETVIYDTAEPVFLPDTLTVLSWNIGYAGLGDDMDFFYDGGKRVRDSRRRTLENLRNIVAELRKADADIMLLQEVDCDSHRSYGIRDVLRKPIRMRLSLTLYSPSPDELESLECRFFPAKQHIC